MLEVVVEAASTGAGLGTPPVTAPSSGTNLRNIIRAPRLGYGGGGGGGDRSGGSRSGGGGGAGEVVRVVGGQVGGVS